MQVRARIAAVRSWRRALARPDTSALPDAWDRVLIQRAAVWMFVGGGGVNGMTALTSDVEVTGPLLVVSGLLVLIAVELALLRRPRLWVLQAHAAAGVVLVGVVVALVGDAGLAPVYLLWPAVLVAWFSSWRALAVHLALLTFVLVTAMAVHGGVERPLDTVVAVLVTAAGIAGVITFLTRRQARLRAELALAADTDPLTGLLNRRAFEVRAVVALARARERGSPLGLVLFDLDHFKRVNDDHGHHWGDEVLVRFARVLRAASRDGDLVARLGGEEFVVLLPGAAERDAVAYTRRVAGALGGQSVGPVTMPTASAGVVTAAGPGAAAGGSVGDAVRLADAAMYAAKAAGRHRTAVWGDPIRLTDLTAAAALDVAT